MWTQGSESIQFLTNQGERNIYVLLFIARQDVLPVITIVFYVNFMALS